MAQTAAINRANTDPDEGWSLPAWTYSDREFFDVEMARIMRPAWQIVCHESDIPGRGDYRTLDYIGESVIAIRSAEGAVRAFTNVCRHRGARLLDGQAGCAKRIVCPYHAWAYDLDGALVAMPLRRNLWRYRHRQARPGAGGGRDLSRLRVCAAGEGRAIDRGDDGAL